jgi:O-antigen/teichoic acid export membrane protein
MNISIVNKTNQEGSLKQRYLFKFFANLFNVLISFIMFSLVSRTLGPKIFGDYNFLVSFFVGIIAFFEMSTSACFYTKLSKRQGDTGLISFYFIFVAVVSALIISALSLSFVTLLYRIIWPGQAVLFISLAAGYGILYWINQILSQIVDAHGLTVPGEIVKIIQKAVAGLVLILFFILNGLNMLSYFFLQYIFLFVLGALLIWTIQSKINLFARKDPFTKREIKDYIREFYVFNSPLFVIGIISLLEGIFDRWLLQYFGGAEQQGYYGFSFFLVTICVLFAKALEPLLTREYAVSFFNQDFDKMRTLFRRYMPLFYSIAAYFACFIAIHSDKIIYIFGGNKYMPATMTLSIMAFYPIHQTYGQLNGSIYYATERTKLYRNIGMAFAVIGVLLSYFLIAPKRFYGFDAGATGLAIKMVVAQFVAVNFELYFNALALKVPFQKYFFHQLIVVFCFLGISLTSLFFTNVLGLKNVFYDLILSGMIYTLAAFAVIYYFPKIVGLSHNDIQNAKNFVFSYIR